MKITMSFILAALILVGSSFQTATDHSLARANRINGKWVFYHCEPVSNYEIAFTFKNIIHNYNCNTIERNIDETLKNANQEAGLQNKLYDAIITGTADRDLAVVFTDKTKDNSTARVKKEDGKYIFLSCEPLTEYAILKKVDVSGEVKMMMLGGKCPTQQEKIDKLLKQGDKKKSACDAVIRGDSKYDLLIKFK